MDRPRVGVVVPTHNRAAYLDEALTSVAAQTWPADDVLVSEDGADDATARVIEKHAAAGLPVRHVRRIPPLGIGQNRRSAYAESRGDLVAMLDDDDRYEPAFIAQAAQALVDNPECGFATTAQSVMSPAGEVLEQDTREHAQRFGRDRLQTGVIDDVLSLELEHKSFPIQTTMLRRSVLEQTSFLTEGRDLDDFQLFLELGARGVKCFYIGEELGRYRDHPASGTINSVIPLSLEVSAALLYMPSRFDLAPRHRAAVAALYRRNIFELAIEHARRGERTAALASLRSYGELGWAPPSPKRVAVLAALLVGVRR